MAKVVFIGAGSFGFTRNLVRDLLTFERLENAEIALVDISRQRLDFARRACEKLVAQGGYGARVTTTTDRRQAPGRGGRGLRHHPAGRHQRLAARHPHPQEVRNRH